MIAPRSAVRRAKLLWLLDSFGPGGAEALTIPFARRYDRERYELVVARHSNRAPNVIGDELARAGVPTFDIGATSLFDRAAFRRLSAFVRAGQFDLVHAHLTYSSLWAALLSRNLGVPSVASLHVAPSATRTLQESFAFRLSTAVRDRLMRLALNRWSRRVIVVSEALRRTYLEGGGIDAKKLVVVHNGIEVERFAHDRVAARARVAGEFGLPERARLAVTVSVLRPKKGIEVLLEAVREVPGTYFVIIGDGSMRGEWEAAAVRQGISDRVRWAGFRRDVDELLAGFDLFVHPSLDDAFPTVLIEAMAAGLPVVASRVGGIPEIVVEGVTGTLVVAGDAAELARAIASLDVTPGVSEAAQRIARERFSTEAWLARLDAVYAEALG